MSERCLNGRFLPSRQAMVAVMDRGFLLGDGAYEVIPPDGGVLRRGDLRLRRLADSLAGIRCLEQPVPLDTLRGADEFSVTSSRCEIMPVTRIDGATVGDGLPDRVWRRLDAQYQQLKRQLRG